MTGDELADPSGLEISLAVNGETRQRSNTANLVFDVSYLVGFARNLQVFMKDGDVVRIEVDRIGVLENRVKKAD